GEVCGGEPVISERHRHRYEVNNAYRPQLVDAGLVVSGTFREGHLVEIIELPDHPWFVASQFHPEFKSRPTRPAPLFREFVQAALERARERRGDRVGLARCLSCPSVSSEVLDLFLQLAAVPSPSGEEREVADRVVRYLRDCGLDADEDGAGAQLGSTTGNVFTRLEPTVPGERVFLCAHFDTVPPTDAIEPVVDDGVVRNARPTILGSDNKAAIAVMLEATRRVLAENRRHAGLELVFTPKEEVGLLGAYAFDHTRLEARTGYVYDQAAAIGEVILGAPSAQQLDITFHGRAAHAGMYPEEGRSASAAAAPASP